jgi:hypothetical protein
MKRFWVQTFVVAVFALLASTVAFSQSSPCPSSSDPSMKAVDSLRVTVTVSGGSASASGSKKGDAAGKGKKASGQIEWVVVIWNTDQGQGPVYSVSPSSITVTGDGSTADGMSTAAVFDLVSQSTIAQLVAQGYIPCTTECPGPTVPRLYTASCVQRVGSGESTQFIACDAQSCCIRYYSVCCPSGPGAPVIQMVKSESTGCSGQGSCQSTCP